MHGQEVCGRGAYMAGGHAWWGACIAEGMCGRGHASQGACVVGACMAGGMNGRGMHGQGCAWWGVGACVAGVCVAGGVHGGRHAWQERWPLQQTVCILVECILVYIQNYPDWSPFIELCKLTMGVT